MKSPVTRQKYQKRLKLFDFIVVEGKTIEDKSITFINRAKTEGNEWVFNNVLKFMLFQQERANRKEITGATVRNYLESIKILCEMADIPISWKNITRGLPRGKNYADDRIPTIDVI